MILCLPVTVKRNSKLFRALLHFLALLLVVAPALAQVYKWVDEKGVTHYGERPPQGSKPQEVPNRLASPLPTDSKRNEDWQQKDREFRERRIQTEAADDKKQQDAAKRNEQCNEQRALLRRLKESPRNFRLGANGERVYLEDSERESAIGRQEKLVAERCPS
jgi:Domain of unknown function (DUF4124)